MPQEQKVWFDWAEAAAWLNDKVPGGMTVRYLQNEKYGKQIQATKLGGRVFFHLNDLQAYVEKVTTTRLHTHRPRGAR